MLGCYTKNKQRSKKANYLQRARDLFILSFYRILNTIYCQILFLRLKKAVALNIIYSVPGTILIPYIMQQLIYYSQQSYKVGSRIIPILQMRKLQCKEGK